MAVENIGNNYATTLAADVTDVATSLTVSSITGVPSVQFRIVIGDEIMVVTAVVGTTFTVTRGAEGTTAAAHTSGDVVAHVLTKEGIDLHASGIALAIATMRI